MTYTINNQTFGIEVEFGGISRSAALNVLATHFGNEIENDYEAAGYLNAKFVRDNQGRKWAIVRDGSVNSMGGEAAELVSPPLKYEDMEDLQEIIRKLRNRGAKVDNSCGIHVHIGLQPYNAKSLRNLIKLYAKYEDLIYRSVDVLENRAEGFAMKITRRHSNLCEKINNLKTIDQIKDVWYGRNGNPNQKYDNSRYSGLNLHNIWYKGWHKGTVEFRIFNGTLHAGKIRSYVTLCLAVSAKALNAKAVNTRQAELIDEIEQWDKFLKSMDITKSNAEMTNVYKHLTTKFNEVTRQLQASGRSRVYNAN